MSTTYKAQFHTYKINAVLVDVAKIVDGELVGIRSFKLRIHPQSEGSDPVAAAIAKHREELHW